MRSLFVIILVFGSSIMISAQDQLILNDSTKIDCKIISVDANEIQYKNERTLETETVLADTIKGYIYKGEIYYNSEHRTKKLFTSYNDPNTEDTYLRLSFLIPGFSFENRITQSIAINAELGTGFATGWNVENGYNEIFIFSMERVKGESDDAWLPKEDYARMYPFFKFEIRKYYSLLRRQNHGRSTINNSANYFSLYSLAFWDDLYYVGPSWGLQRNENRFYFNLNIGGGIYWWSEGSAINPLVDVKLGILLN